MTDMKVFGTVSDMLKARNNLGAPASLDEAITATGIDAFFWLLGGGEIELEDKRYRLMRVPTEGSEE